MHTPDERDEDTLTLKQLIDLTGESERTLRYYMQLGLLSGPTSSGPTARYSPQNVRTVAHIRQRQREGVGLREIQRELMQLPAEPGPLFAQARGPGSSAPATDALEYLQRQGLAAPRALPRARRSSWPPEREQWERRAIDDGIELWVRRPLDPHRQKLLMQLLDRAEELFMGPNRPNSQEVSR